MQTGINVKKTGNLGGRQMRFISSGKIYPNRRGVFPRINSEKYFLVFGKRLLEVIIPQR
jgi:hypothetical protein